MVVGIRSRERLLPARAIYLYWDMFGVNFGVFALLAQHEKFPWLTLLSVLIERAGFYIRC